jgi:hypothetical protein
MDEEYVQEHILTGGVVAPVGGTSPPHSWPFAAHFARHCRVIRGAFAMRSALRACVVRAADNCALI